MTQNWTERTGGTDRSWPQSLLTIKNCLRRYYGSGPNSNLDGISCFAWHAQYPSFAHVMNVYLFARHVVSLAHLLFMWFRFCKFCLATNDLFIWHLLFFVTDLTRTSLSSLFRVYRSKLVPLNERSILSERQTIAPYVLFGNIRVRDVSSRSICCQDNRTPFSTSDNSDAVEPKPKRRKTVKWRIQRRQCKVQARSSGSTKIHWTTCCAFQQRLLIGSLSKLQDREIEDMDSRTKVV